MSGISGRVCPQTVPNKIVKNYEEWTSLNSKHHADIYVWKSKSKKTKQKGIAN